MRKLTYTREQLSEGTTEPESPPYTLPLSEVLFKEIGSWFYVVPPFNVLNEVLRQGKTVNGQNILFRWDPFELNKVEYKDLLKEVRGHPEWKTDIDDPPKEMDMSEWSQWALERFANKQKLM